MKTIAEACGCYGEDDAEGSMDADDMLPYSDLEDASLVSNRRDLRFAAAEARINFGVPRDPLIAHDNRGMSKHPTYESFPRLESP